MTPYIDIHTHGTPDPDSYSISNLRLYSSDPVIPTSGLFSAGIHPWDTLQAEESWLSLFDQHPGRLIAIGETGLDYRTAYQPYDTQRKWFQQQIEIANRLNKPLILHCVHATQDCIHILRQSATTPILLHGFTGSRETLRQWLQQIPDISISFGPYLLKSPKTQDALLYLAQEHPHKLFLETDGSPDLSIQALYHYTATLTHQSASYINELTHQNFNHLFPHISF